MCCTWCEVVSHVFVRFCLDEPARANKREDDIPFSNNRYFNEDDDPLPCFETAARSSGDFITFVWDKLFAAYPVTIHSTEEELLKIPVKVLREHLKKRGVKCVGCTDKREIVKSVMEM